MIHSETNNSAERRLFSKASLKRIPINGSIELLPVCNMDCDMCYVRLSMSEVNASGGLRRVDEWLKAAREMKDTGTLFLLLTGGEPLLYPGFKELYLELIKMGMVLTINTNGTLIDEEWADFFRKNKPRRINVTLYGSDEITYERLCHYPSGFKKTMRGIKLLKDAGVDIKISVSLTKANQDQINDFFRIGSELNIPVNVDTYMLPATRERNKLYDMQSRMSPKDAAKAHLIILEKSLSPKELIQSLVKAVVETERFVPGKSKPLSLGCYAGKCSFTINWQGEMRPCVVMSEPSVSVFDGGFSRAWQYIADEVEKLRFSSKCSVCNKKAFCQTCAASSLYESGSYEEPADYLCAYSEELFKLMKLKLSSEGVEIFYD